jgi:molecular chaperone GrpE
MSEKQKHQPEKTGPRKVKVTDRRRVTSESDDAKGIAAEPRPEGPGVVESARSWSTDGGDDAAAKRADQEPGVDESRGSKTSEASNAEANEGSVPETERGGESKGSSTSAASGRSAAPLAKDAPGATRDEVAELHSHLQRMAADFDNYRKRVLKEQTRAVEMAAEPLIRRLLEVLDEFDLALIAAEQKPDFEKFLHGVELVYAKLLDTLRGEGLEKIEVEGKPFDPSLHEALMQTGDAEGDPFVADVLRPGYTLRGRVIRPAGVKVVRK